MRNDHDVEKKLLQEEKKIYLANQQKDLKQMQERNQKLTEQIAEYEVITDQKRAED